MAQSVRYFRDYVENMGLPMGVGEMSASDHLHAYNAYKFMYNGSRLDSIALVNAEDRPVDFYDTEHLDSYRAAKISYSQDGKPECITAYSSTGEFMYKLMLSHDLKSATYRNTDSSPYFLRLGVSAHYGNLQSKGSISSLILSYYPNGNLRKKIFADKDGNPAADANMIYGIEYSYNSSNLMTRYSFLDEKGNIAQTYQGHASTKIEYDKHGNRTRFAYLDKNNSPSHDGSMISVIENECDKYGNLLKQTYKNMKGAPMLRPDINVAAMEIKYDNQGHRIQTSYLGLDGKPICNNGGVAYEQYKTDQYGYACQTNYYNLDDIPTFNRNSGAFASKQQYDTMGRLLEATLLMHNSKDNGRNIASIRHEYNNDGKLQKTSYYDGYQRPALGDEGFHMAEYTYNGKNQLIETRYYGTDGRPANNSYGESILITEYNEYGNIASQRCLDTLSRKTMHQDMFYSLICSYDGQGRLVERLFLDTLGNPSASASYAKWTCQTNPETGATISESLFNRWGSEIQTTRYEYNDCGLHSQIQQISNGEVMGYTRFTYHPDGRTASKCVFQNGYQRPHVTRYELDRCGNVVKESFFNEDGSIDTIESGMHCVEHTFNSLQLKTHTIYRDVNGASRPMTKVNNEMSFEYDEKGNLIKSTVLDGKGNIATGIDGWSIHAIEYNERNQPILYEFANKDLKLVVSQSTRWARMRIKYMPDNTTPHMRLIYNAEGKPFAMSVYSKGDWSEWLTENDLQQMHKN